MDKDAFLAHYACICMLECTYAHVYVHYTYIVYCTTLCKKVTEKTVSEKLRKETKEKVPIFLQESKN